MSKTFVLVVMAAFATIVSGCDTPTSPSPLGTIDIQPRVINLAVGQTATFQIIDTQGIGPDFKLEPESGALDFRSSSREVVVTYIRRVQGVDKVDLDVSWYCGGGAICHRRATIYLN